MKELIVEPGIVRGGIDKHHFLARLTTAGAGFNYYHENEYYDEFKDSFFALTKKKAGWDCMRHYEIAACGCLPVFHNLDELPKGTMVHWDRKLLSNIYEEFWGWRLEANYLTLRDAMLEHIQKDLTTESMFKYILSKL